MRIGTAPDAPEWQWRDLAEPALGDDTVRIDQWSEVAAQLARALAGVLALRPPSDGQAGEVEFAGCDALDDYEALQRRIAEGRAGSAAVVFQELVSAAAALAWPLRRLFEGVPESSPEREAARAALAAYARLRTVDDPGGSAAA